MENICPATCPPAINDTDGKAPAPARENRSRSSEHHASTNFPRLDWQPAMYGAAGVLASDPAHTRGVLSRVRAGVGEQETVNSLQRRSSARGTMAMNRSSHLIGVYVAAPWWKRWPLCSFRRLRRHNPFLPPLLATTVVVIASLYTLCPRTPL